MTDDAPVAEEEEENELDYKILLEEALVNLKIKINTEKNVIDNLKSEKQGVQKDIEKKIKELEVLNKKQKDKEDSIEQFIKESKIARKEKEGIALEVQKEKAELCLFLKQSKEAREQTKKEDSATMAKISDGIRFLERKIPKLEDKKEGLEDEIEELKREIDNKKEEIQKINKKTKECETKGKEAAEELNKKDAQINGRDLVLDKLSKKEKELGEITKLKQEEKAELAKIEIEISLKRKDLQEIVKKSDEEKESLNLKIETNRMIMEELERKSLKLESKIKKHGVTQFLKDSNLKI